MPIVGVGVDIVACPRVARLLGDHGVAAMDRLFTRPEQEYCRPRKRSIEHFAARFAGKEAVLKALGTGWRGGIAWTDMQFLPDSAGKPVLTLTGESLKIATSLGIAHWHVTLSHTEEFAIGYAVAES